MTATRSPFDVLGLSEDATSGEVRRAYRRQAFRFHPDRNPGDAAAAEAFLAVKEAYERLDPRDPDAGFDAERVVAQMQRAADEAERRRGRAASGGRAWQQVRVPLRPSPGVRARAALGSPQALAGLGIAAVVAMGTALGGVAPAWVGALVGLGLGGALVRHATRSAEPLSTWAVETHWQGLRDLRWDVLLSWSEIRDVREGVGAVDLALTEHAARRLAALVPPSTFPEPALYRLPLRDASRLGPIVRAQLAGEPTPA